MAKILLADDDAAVRELVSRALTSEGHTVAVTQDGAEALEYFEANPGAVDIIVTDVDMPALDGVSLAEQAIAQNPRLSIVLMSGFSEQLDRAARLKARRLISITKPFTLEQIKQAVRAVVA
ncbi:MAG: response regulator [Hyphomicrobium sp.]